MPVRYRRNRLLIILCFCLFVIFYWQNNLSPAEPLDHFEEHPKGDKEVEPVVAKGEAVQKSEAVRSTSRLIREEIVEINGKKLRKIDWHDYEAIARDQARTGTLVRLASQIELIFKISRFGREWRGC